jgi:hypothetical protein
MNLRCTRKGKLSNKIIDGFYQLKGCSNLCLYMQNRL